MARPPEGDIEIPGEGGGYKSPILKKHLWPHHINMARMAAVGATPKEIAQATGFSAGQVSRILGSPLFQVEVARLSDDIDEFAVAQVQDELRQLSCRAAEVLAEDLDIEPRTAAERTIRQRAAFDILDRTGHGKADQPSLHLHAHVHKEAAEMATEDLLQDVLEFTKTG